MKYVFIQKREYIPVSSFNLPHRSSRRSFVACGRRANNIPRTLWSFFLNHFILHLCNTTTSATRTSRRIVKRNPRDFFSCAIFSPFNLLVCSHHWHFYEKLSSSWACSKVYNEAHLRRWKLFFLLLKLQLSHGARVGGNFFIWAAELWCWWKARRKTWSFYYYFWKNKYSKYSVLKTREREENFDIVRVAQQVHSSAKDIYFIPGEMSVQKKI